MSNSGIARPNLLECSRYLREECYSVSKMACYVSADEDSESVHSLSEEEAMPETYKRIPKVSKSAAGNPPQRSASKRQKKLPAKFKDDYVLSVSKEEEKLGKSKLTCTDTQ